MKNGNTFFPGMVQTAYLQVLWILKPKLGQESKSHVHQQLQGSTYMLLSLPLSFCGPMPASVLFLSFLSPHAVLSLPLLHFSSLPFPSFCHSSFLSFCSESGPSMLLSQPFLLFSHLFLSSDIVICLSYFYLFIVFNYISIVV